VSWEGSLDSTEYAYYVSSYSLVTGVANSIEIGVIQSDTGYLLWVYGYMEGWSGEVWKRKGKRYEMPEGKLVDTGVYS
jgi:hypothetical protein